MDIIVKTSTREVICSGSLILPHGDYIEFVIRNLRFRLSFDYHNDEGRSFVQPQVVHAENSQESYMEIRAFNFDNIWMRTFTTPILLAQQDGRALSLGLLISSVNRRDNSDNPNQQIEDKYVSYTWYWDLPQPNPANG